MKRWDIIIELSAQQDITQAYLWLAERAPDAAERWFNSIYETIGSLENFSERCPLARESKFLKREIREILHGRRQHKHRVLFTTDEDHVHVLHVRHGARLALGETSTEE